MFEDLFSFVSHIKTVEAHQIFACWQCLWKLQKCCYKICASFASDTQSRTQLSMVPSVVHWKICREKRMMGDVDRCRGSSNFFVD